MEGSFSGVMNPTDRGELGGNQMVIQQYARYPAAMEPALPSASSVGSARSRMAASKSPPLQRRDPTPRSLQASPTGQRSILHRASSAQSGPSMSPPVFDPLRRRQSRESMDRAESRALPSRDITDESIDDAYVTFIFYCNPNVPGSVDTSELRKTFRSPPRSDGKSFSIFNLWELIRRFDSKEVKTWIQLAIELGVEPPDMEKKQSTQKVQQYAVRLKRWMRAMHVDAFFEFCLGHPHPYYTQLPSANASVSDSRDGVPLEEDLALRALVPQWKPKRGRKRAEDRDLDFEGPTKRPQLDTSVGVLHGGSFPTHSAAFPHSAIPFSAFPDEMETSDPWMTTTSSFPADAPNGQQTQDMRWRPLERDASPGGYPQSAIIPRGNHPSDLLMSSEPRSAVTPSTGEKSRSRRRHGPAVSSAWPGSNGSSGGKARGRPPNKGTVSGPFSSFPVNPARGNPPAHGESSDARSSPAIALDQHSFGHFSESQNHQSPTPGQGNRPGKLQLQVPQHPGAPVRLATPPTLLVNGVNDTKVEGHHPNGPHGPSHMSTVSTNMQNENTKYSPDNVSSDELVRLLSNELLRAKVMGRPAPVEPGEAHALAATIMERLIDSLSGAAKESSTLFCAIHLGLGSHFGVPRTTSGSMIVNIEPVDQPSAGTIYNVTHEYNYGSSISTKVTYKNLRIDPPSNDNPVETSRTTEQPTNNIVEELDDFTDAEFEVDGGENGASDATWKQRYLRLRAQMQKKDRSLSQYKRRILESVMAEV